MLEKKQRKRIANTRYRHLIEVWDIRPSEVNEIGQTVQEPVLIEKLWAKVEPMRGKEYFISERITSEARYKITTRYRESINESMFIKWPLKNKSFEIISLVDILGNEKHLEIICEERVDTYEGHGNKRD